MVNTAAKREAKLIKAYEGPSDAIAEDGGGSICLRGMGIYSHGDSKASIQFYERGGEVEQTRGYRCDSVVLHVPTAGRRMVKPHNGDGVGGHEEGKCCTGSAATH